MSLKLEFVERIEKGEKIAALCREFKVTRTTGHKWWKRYKEGGYAALEEQSRRPKSAPLATAEDIVIAVLAERAAHPRWGPRKLEVVLRRRFGEQTPSERTVARILRRAQKVRERRRRRPISVVDRAPQVQAQAPNDVWSVDFKGWWRTLDGARCEPLTVRDACSRFVLTTAIVSTREAVVRPIFEQLFRRYGLPKSIQCDNGVPFISVRARCGLSALSAWWVSLGIAIVRSRPGSPQDNGGHERMHSDMAAEVQAWPAPDQATQQKALDRWRQEFNHVRPHEALGGKTPAEVYKVQEKRKPKVYTYPRGMLVRLADAGGGVSLDGERYILGLPFKGLSVGLQFVDRFHVRVWLHELDLGSLEVVPLVHVSHFDEPTALAVRKKRGRK